MAMVTPLKTVNHRLNWMPKKEHVVIIGDFNARDTRRKTMLQRKCYK